MIDSDEPIAYESDPSPLDTRRNEPGMAVLSSPNAVETASQPDDEITSCLVEELQLCLRYHQSMFPDHHIEKIVFLGGASRQVQRCQAIAQALRISAQLGDPLARLVRPQDGAPPSGLDMRQPQPGWAVPMGLCLGSS